MYFRSSLLVLSAALALILFSSTVIAGDPSIYFSGVFKDEDNGQTHLHLGRKASVSYQQLEQFWNSLGKIDRKDSNNQPWKSVSITQMKELVGDIPEQYLLINPVYKIINPGKGDEHTVIVDYELELRKVTGTSLNKWGCDESLSTVVHIGKWPIDDMYNEGPMVIPYRTEMGRVILTALDTSLVPKEIIQKAKKPLQGFSLLGIESGFAASVVTVHEPDEKYVHYRDYLFIKENDEIKTIRFESAYPLC